jgi:hypothetical protein
VVFLLLLMARERQEDSITAGCFPAITIQVDAVALAILDIFGFTLVFLYLCQMLHKYVKN